MFVAPKTGLPGRGEMKGGGGWGMSEDAKNRGHLVSQVGGQVGRTQKWGVSESYSQ